MWENIFVPAAELRSYTRLVVEALGLMLAAAAKRPAAKDSRVPAEQYEATLDKIASLVSYGALSKEVAALHSAFQVNKSRRVTNNNNCCLRI